MCYTYINEGSDLIFHLFQNLYFIVLLGIIIYEYESKFEVQIIIKNLNQINENIVA
jgi:hypothetical protein